MSASSDALEPLIGLGLTPNQSKIYLTMAKSKADTVTLISKNSGISSETVYRNMPSLEKKGLVEKILATPVRYRAISAKEAVKALTREDRKARNDIYQKAGTLAQNVMNCFPFQQNQESEDELQIITGVDSLLRILNKSFGKARDSFDGITFPSKFRFGMLHGNFKQMVWRGVKCRHVVSYLNEPLSFDLGDRSLLNNPLWIRKQVLGNSSVIFTDVVLIDQEELFIGVTSRQIGKNHVVLRTRNPGFLTVAKGFYEAFWNTINNQEGEELS